MKKIVSNNLFFLVLLITIQAVSQHKKIDTLYKVPKGETLTFGGRFKDRFKPVPILNSLTEKTWGAKNVIPRDISNGIEDEDWSYWGGKILKGEDNKYHMFPSRWPEKDKRGHRLWMYSEIVHAVSDNPLGPYKVVSVIGPGTNPFIYKLEDGTYIIYAFSRTDKKALTYYYVSRTGLYGRWIIGDYSYDLRDRDQVGAYLDAANFSITKRDDGTFLAVDKKGTMLISKTGVSKWHAVGSGRVYPKIKGAIFEDPTIWKDSIQYHMITHDPQRNKAPAMAYYLRSKDGVNWVEEPGIAYNQFGISNYEDGRVQNWKFYERVMVLQDTIGRAVQANFAVLDVDKDSDKGNDNHSSKNICIPLVKEKVIKVLNDKKIDAKTKYIDLLIKAEKDFNPHMDIEIKSLRFGASSEVNFGRGAKVKEVKKQGKDLIVRFKTKGNGFTKANFAGKLLGKTKSNNLLIGWAKLPEIKYNTAILSSVAPKIITKNNFTRIITTITNFGTTESNNSLFEVEFILDNKVIGKVKVASLKPFEETKIGIDSLHPFTIGKKYKIGVRIIANGSEIQENLTYKVLHH